MSKHLAISAIIVALLAVSAHGVVLRQGLASSSFPPTFKNKGGPPDSSGSWVGEADGEWTTGIETKDGYAYSFAPFDGSAQSASFAKYKSWQCTGKGSYKAYLKETVIMPNGSKEVTFYCEIGKIDLTTGIYRWAASDKACPTRYTNTLTRAGSFATPCSYTCK